MLRTLSACALLLPSAALAQGQEIVVTGRGLPRAAGESA